MQIFQIYFSFSLTNFIFSRTNGKARNSYRLKKSGTQSSVAQVFRRFLCEFWTDFLAILHRHFQVMSYNIFKKSP